MILEKFRMNAQKQSNITKHHIFVGYRKPPSTFITDQTDRTDQDDAYVLTIHREDFRGAQDILKAYL